MLNLIRSLPDVTWHVYWTEPQEQHNLGFGKLKQVGLSGFVRDPDTLAGKLQRDPVEILFFYANMLPVDAWPLLSEESRPLYVYTAGTNSETSFAPWRRAKKFIRQTICVSEQIADSLERENCTVITTGVDTDLFGYQKHPKSRTLEFGYMGRIARKKQLQLIPNALRGYGERFTVYGPATDGAVLLGQLKSACVGAGVELVYHGPTKKPWKEYHNFDVQLLYTKREGMPNSVLEAAACGIPTISRNVGDLAKTFEHDMTIWFADSANEFRLQICKLCDKPGEVERVGFNARKLVERKHSAKKMAKEYLAVFEKVLEGK